VSPVCGCAAHSSIDQVRPHCQISRYSSKILTYSVAFRKSALMASLMEVRSATICGLCRTMLFTFSPDGRPSKYCEKRRMNSRRGAPLASVMTPSTVWLMISSMMDDSLGRKEMEPSGAQPIVDRNTPLALSPCDRQPVSSAYVSSTQSVARWMTASTYM